MEAERIPRIPKGQNEIHKIVFYGLYHVNIFPGFVVFPTQYSGSSDGLCLEELTLYIPGKTVYCITVTNFFFLRTFNFDQGELRKTWKKVLTHL